MPRPTKVLTNVSERNTKNEILEAYQELLAKARGEVGEEEVTSREQDVVSTAAKETVEKVTHDLAQLRMSANQTISTLTEQLTDEAERFAGLKKAIVTLQTELAEGHQIKLRAGMLKHMVEIQKEEERRFEQEMQEKRHVWTEEQKMYEDHMKQVRTREEEEYRYQEKLKRQREIDTWQEETRQRERTQKETQEKQLQDKQELENLRGQVAQFPLQLEKTVKESVTRAVSEEKKDAEVKQKFAHQEAETKAQLAAMSIASQEKMVKEQAGEIADLKRQLESATRQVKEIAVAVIEGPKRDNDHELPVKP